MTTDAARSCFGKTRYSDESIANGVAASCYRERGTWLRVYACTECGGFHLTKQNAMPPANANWRPPRKSERQHRIDRERTYRRRRGRK